MKKKLYFQKKAIALYYGKCVYKAIKKKIVIIPKTVHGRTDVKGKLLHYFVWKV